MRWRDLVIPSLPRKELGKMMLVTLLGALLAGLYGVLHDQITYRICDEYFTRNKFDQFYYARPASGSDLEFASRIGFLATWWVGGLTAWGFARISVARTGSVAGPSVMARAFGLVFAISAITAPGGWFWSQWKRKQGYAPGWIEWMEGLGVENETAFMTVGYIHNASYLGGVLGMIVGMLYLRKALPANTGER